MTEVVATSKFHRTAFLVTVLPGDVGVMNVTAPDMIYSGYAPKDINVTFSDERFATPLKYSTNTKGVYVEDGKIWAEGDFSSDVEATVTVKSEYHTKTVTVKVSTFNKNNKTDVPKKPKQ